MTGPDSTLRARVAAVVVLAVSLLALASAAVTQEQDPAEELQERIWELRKQARYSEAAEVAKKLLLLRKEDTKAKAWEIADAERLVSTLEYVENLREQARQELALADSLTDVFNRYYRMGQYAEGADAVGRQLEIRRRLLGDEHPDIANSLNDLGLVLQAQGDYAGAEGPFHEAFAMWKKLLGDEHPDVAISLNNLACLLMDQRDYAGAERPFREAIVAKKKLLGDEHPDVATSLNNLALCLQRQRDYAGAEALYRDALAMWRKSIGDDVRVADTLHNLASLLRAQGDYAGAEPLYRQALAMTKKLLGDEHPDVATTLNHLGMALRGQGDYACTEPLFREALAMRRRLLGGEHPLVAQSLNNLAYLLYMDQGDYAGAEPLFREALAIWRERFGDEHVNVAVTLNNLGHLLQAKEDYTGAEASHREALAMFRKLFGDEDPHIATSLHNVASLLLAQGDYAGAEPLFQEALAMRRKLLGSEHVTTAISLYSLASLLGARGEYAGAEPFSREALAIRKNLLGHEHPVVASSLRDLARLLRAQGDYVGAEQLLTEAGRVLESARLRAGSGFKRATLAHTLYAELAAARLAIGRLDDAWPAAEKAQARALADLLMASGTRDLSPSEAALEDTLKEALGNRERELGAYSEAAREDTTAASQDRADNARNQLLAAEADWSAFHQEMAAKYPVTEGQAFSLDRIQSALSQHVALVGWLDVEAKKGEYDSWGYVVRSSGPVRWAHLAISSEAATNGSSFDEARAFRYQLAAPGFLGLAEVRDAGKLWRERIRPLSDTLEGVEELIVIPSGAMLGLPVETLADDQGVFLGDRYAVSYIPSATIYTWLSEKARETEGKALALLVGDPPFTEAHAAAMEREEVVLASTEVVRDAPVLRAALAGNDAALASLPHLPRTREEISSVAGFYSEATVLAGPDASEQELVRLAEAGTLKDYEVIHLATHALMDDEWPERSALVLSQVDLPDPLEAAMAGTRIYDGLLTAKEILREWDLSADLVTLSACETGLGKEVLGEGYVGFAHAFLQAGARSLLVSLWPVEDEATSLLMRRFYENRTGKYADDRGAGAGQPMSKAKALQEAKHWLRTYEDEYGRQPFEHPYFWSAFILIGDRG